MNSFRSPRRLPGLASVLAIAALASAPSGVNGQEPSDSLRAEVARLTALVDSLRQEVERLQAAGQEAAAGDALAELRAAAAAAAGAPPEPADPDQEFVGRQRSLQSLNPEISVNADVFAHLNPDDPDADNFVPREFEISLISNLDPYSRAALFISRHAEGPEVIPFAADAEHGDGHGHGDEEGGGGFGVEEGYVEWVGLPGGIGLKLGKFQQQITTLNRWHAHALPFQSRSLPHLAFFGEEALSQTGAALSWLAPFGGGSAGTYQFSLEATRSENGALWGEAASPNYLGSARAFYQLGDAVDIEIGGSWLTGHLVEEGEQTIGRSVRSLEMALNWLPPDRSRHTGLTVRAGLMQLVGLEEHTDPGAPGPVEEHESVSGFWSMAELRLNQSWLIGARFDRVANPLEPDVTQWLLSPTLTWWQSEFVRLRAEYDFLSGIEGGDGTGMFVLQATFAMGPHKHATY